jgi:hypothetical protein
MIGPKLLAMRIREEVAMRKGRVLRTPRKDHLERATAEHVETMEMNRNAEVTDKGMIRPVIQRKGPEGMTVAGTAERIGLERGMKTETVWLVKSRRTT